MCGLGRHARCGARRAIDGPTGTGQAIERRLGGGDAGRNEPQPQGPPPGPLRAPKTFGRVAAGPPASEQQGAVAIFRAAGPPGARVGLAGKVALIPAHLALPDPPPAEAPPALGPEPPAQRVPSHGAPDGGAGRGPGRGPRRGTGPRWGGEAMQGLPRPQAARVPGWRRRLTRRDVEGGCCEPPAVGQGTQDTATRPGHPPNNPRSCSRAGRQELAPGRAAPTPEPLGHVAEAPIGLKGEQRAVGAAVGPQKIAVWTLTWDETEPGSQGPHGGPAGPWTATFGLLARSRRLLEFVTGPEIEQPNLSTPAPPHQDFLAWPVARGRGRPGRLGRWGGPGPPLV